MTEAEIREALNSILDPCSVAAGAPAGIAELGLLRTLAVEQTSEGTRVEATIGVTEPGCLMGASFVVKARALLDEMPEIAEHEIRLDHAADWEPGDIDPAYVARLEAVRQGRRDGVVAPAPARPFTSRA